MGWLSFVNRTSIIATSVDKEEQFNNASITATLAKDIRSVAEKARNEEELRIGVEKLLEPALRKLGIRS